MAYATVAQLTAWLDPTPVPDDAERQLDRASQLIDRATVAAVYDVTDGTATDADVLQALADSTCAQVAWWMATGDELGDVGRWTSVSIGSASLSTGGGSGGGSTRRLAPAAAEILVTAGLVPAVTL